MEDLTGGIVQGRLNFRFANEKVINFNITKRGTSRGRSKNEKMGMSKGNIKRVQEIDSRKIIIRLHHSRIQLH